MRISTFKYLALLLLFSSRVSGSSDYSINLPEALKGTPTGTQIKAFYTKVYQEIGINPRFTFIPAKRGFGYLKHNKIQAEAFRVGHVGKDNNLTTQLYPPISQVKVAVFCIERKKCKIDKTFVYVIPEGFEYGKTICRELDIKCELITSPFILNKMLENNTVDAALYPYPAYKKALCNSSKQQLHYKELSEHTFDIFHFVNTTNEMLINKIEESLQKQLSKNTLNLHVFNGKPDLKLCGKYLSSL